jgi:hypothetical protein
MIQSAALISLVLALQPASAAFLGAFALYVFNRQQGKIPFSLFRALNINVSDAKAKPITIGADMIISSLLGAAVVLVATEPATMPQALFAGLGMTGMLSTHIKEISS